MPHQDWNDIVSNRRTLKQAVDFLLPARLFNKIKMRGNALWQPQLLALAALLRGALGHSTLGERFSQARKIVVALFPRRKEPGVSEQGFLKTLASRHAELISAFVPHLRRRMREILPGQWKVAGYALFDVDGSRVELPRTKANEDAYAPQKKRKKRKTKAAKKKKQSAASIAKKKDSPQMWLTLLRHVGTGLPWDWRTGPSDSSERGHLEDMLDELPENALLTMDAGFVGYDFWNAILESGRNFLVRVGGNVRLLKGLGYARQSEQTVYLWPDGAARKGREPLTLRLLAIHNGKQPIYLATNLKKSELSDAQAAKVYGARWGIELFFRTFKQTFDRGKLRSKSAENAQLELDWSLLSLWCILLLGLRELSAAGKDPTRLSPVGAIRAFRNLLCDDRVFPKGPEETYAIALRLAVLDDYKRTRSKTSRNYPRKKKKRALASPKVETAAAHQIAAAKELRAPNTTPVTRCAGR